MFPCNQSIGTDKVNMDKINENIKNIGDCDGEEITLQSFESEFEN